MSRKEIVVGTNTKGIIVYCKSKIPSCPDWIILISQVKTNISPTYEMQYDVVYTYVLICIDKGKVIETSTTKYHYPFCTPVTYKFYEATKNEKNLIKNFLKKQNLKYVKSFNRIINR